MDTKEKQAIDFGRLKERAATEIQGAIEQAAMQFGSGAIEMEAAVGVHIGTMERGMLPFTLISRQDANSETGKVYEATTPDRRVVWLEKTPERAVAAMLHGVAMLARDGSMDPNEPGRVGAPPIQHVLNILSERLAWHVARRRESYLAAAQARANEVISALGTAISALARIKDL
jgi:hypothetical protein